MLSKKEKCQQKDSDLETNRSQESEELDFSFFSTTSTCKTKSPVKRVPPKKMHMLDFSSSSDQDWRTQFTRSVRKDQSQKLLEATGKRSDFKRKYPRELTNLKVHPVQVKQKDNTTAKYEDLCSICLDKYSNIRGQLGCGHKFCFECIEEWVNTSTKCPCCRESFNEYVRVTMNDKGVEKKREIIEVEEKVMQFNELDYYICYNCDRGDDQDVLLVCDICQFYCCHVYCDPSLYNIFPEGEWYCKNCKESLRLKQEQDKKASKPSKKQPIKSPKKPTIKINRPNYAQNQTQDQQPRGDSEYRCRVTRSMSNLQMNFQTRSKAYQIISLRPRHQANNVSSSGNRITNSTAVNLRNLRRRRIS